MQYATQTPANDNAIIIQIYFKGCLQSAKTNTYNWAQEFKYRTIIKHDLKAEGLQRLYLSVF